MFEIWGLPSPYKSGGQKHLFSTTSQVNGKTATSMAYIFGTEQDIHNW